MFLMGVMPIYPRWIPVDLPSSLHATAQPKAMAEDAMHVCVTRDGRVYFRNYSAQPKSLAFLIRNAMQERAERKVYLSVDSRARYGDAAVVVEQIGKAGIREICFLASKPEGWSIIKK
jgi:biopolymer transport protein ExbD